MRQRPAIRHLVALAVVVCVLASGSSVLAAEAVAPPSGVIAVSTSGSVRALDVPTFPAKRASAPVTDVALSPTGLGYLTIDRDGATYAYGDAVRPGAAKPPRKGVAAVAVEPTPSGQGALVVFSDGSVRALGDAANVSSGAADRTPVVDAALTPSGAGLWLLHRSGAVRALGDASSYGRAAASGSPTTGIAATPTGQGMWIAREDGSVVALGDAEGERRPRVADAPKVTGIAPLGALDDWVLVDVEGNVERRGESPQPLPGEGNGVVALDTTASSAAVTSAGPDAPQTKIVSPGIVLRVTGDPAGTLMVELPCFVTGGPAAIGVGDVVAAAIGPQTPNGLLRTVTALGPCAGGRIVATTVPATLSDALPSGEIDFSDELADLSVPDSAFNPTPLDGQGSVTPVPASPLSAPPTSASGMTVLEAGAPAVTAAAVGTVAEPGRFQYGCPSDPDDEDPSLKAKPIFSFNPDVIFEGEWDGDEAHLRTGISLQGEIGVEFSANKGISCDATFALIDDYSLGTRVFFVGWLPVVVEPQLTLEAKLEGSVGGELTATASATGTATGTLDVDVDSTPTYDFSGSLDAQGNLDWELEAKAELSFSLTPSIGFLLYGVVAPTAELESGLDATLDPCESPQLKLEQPAKLAVKLEPSEWFGEMLEPLENLDLEVANEFALPGSPYLLWSGPQPVPLPCDEDATTLPEGQVDVPYSTTLAVALPAGATGPVYAVSDGSELPEGLTLAADGTLSGTPLASGIHTFSVDVTHSLGSTSAAFEITIREAAELEILTTSLPGASLDEPYSHTLQANRPADDLVWTLKSGTLPDGVTLDPDGTLAGTPTETGYFPFTVNVVHPDSGQTAEKILALAVQTQRIAFMSTRDGYQQIYVMNADGTGQTRLTNNVLQESAPSFSANGPRITYMSGRENGPEVYVMNADGTGQTRLTNNSVFEAAPSFSADGTKIAFESAREPDPIYGVNRDIYVMNADGSNQTRLTTFPGADTEPSFSGDGTRIAFVSYRDGDSYQQIYVMNADGSGQTRLTTDAGSRFEPSFSPDGTRIAFSSDRDGNREIYVMNADGSAQTRLTSNGAPDSSPSFSPDGMKIAFVSYRDGNWEIYVMNADGSGQTRVTNNAAYDGQPTFGG